MPVIVKGRWIALVLLAALVAPTSAWARKVSWLDDVVRRAVREADVGGRAAARVEGKGARAAGRLFVRESEESLEVLTRRSDGLARVARRLDEPAEAALELRFQRLVRPDPEMARTFAALGAAERRLVVEMGETAQRLARRYPGQAENMIRKLGVEGMSAVRAFGDDVAEVIVREGPATIGVLRKTGRGGWRFMNESVLPHKKKLIAAGVFTLFLANPEKFVDSAGRATQYAADQFARAGVSLAGAVGDGALRGLESAVGDMLAPFGLDWAPVRWFLVGLVSLVALVSLMILLGLPIRWITRPITWPLRRLIRRPGTT